MTRQRALEIYDPFPQSNQIYWNVKWRDLLPEDASDDIRTDLADCSPKDKVKYAGQLAVTPFFLGGMKLVGLPAKMKIKAINARSRLEDVTYTAEDDDQLQAVHDYIGHHKGIHDVRRAQKEDMDDLLYEEIKYDDHEPNPDHDLWLMPRHQRNIAVELEESVDLDLMESVLTDEGYDVKMIEEEQGLEGKTAAVLQATNDDIPGYDAADMMMHHRDYKGTQFWTDDTPQTRVRHEADLRFEEDTLYSVGGGMYGFQPFGQHGQPNEELRLLDKYLERHG